MVLNHRLFVVYECGINISIIFSSLFHYYRIYSQVYSGFGAGKIKTVFDYACYADSNGIDFFLNLRVVSEI
jgi:hypothetical protein